MQLKISMRLTFRSDVFLYYFHCIPMTIPCRISLEKQGNVKVTGRVVKGIVSIYTAKKKKSAMLMYQFRKASVHAAHICTVQFFSLSVRALGWKHYFVVLASNCNNSGRSSVERQYFTYR